MSLKTDKLEQYADLYLKRKYHKEQASKIGKQIEELESGLLEHLTEEGVQKVSLKNGKTIFVASQIWPKYGHKSNAIKAIKDAGIEGMIEEGFNHHKLASYIREKIKMEEDLPEEFRGLIEAETKFSLRAKDI
jgi:hypothetical protein